jgi:hypothetical protein
MHLTEGWLLFLVALSVLAAFSWVGGFAERWIMKEGESHA